MVKTMTPSLESPSMTDGQIDKAVDLYRNLLRKHRNELGSDAVQQVIGSSDYVDELVAVLRRRAETVSDLIVRRVKVNRGRTPQEAFKATGCNLYVSDDVVATMPRVEGEETDVYFFKLNRYISDADLEKEYQLRGLTPADPYSLAAVNEADPAFADERPNGTHWQDRKGEWCFAAFDRWRGERDVRVGRYDGGWHAYWWFAGLRK